MIDYFFSRISLIFVFDLDITVGIVLFEISLSALLVFIVINYLYILAATVVIDIGSSSFWLTLLPTCPCPATNDVHWVAVAATFRFVQSLSLVLTLSFLSFFSKRRLLGLEQSIVTTITSRSGFGKSAPYIVDRYRFPATFALRLDRLQVAQRLSGCRCRVCVIILFKRTSNTIETCQS